MAYPSDDLSTRLRSLDDAAGRATLFPDVPETRLQFLRQIRTWARSHTGPGRVLPRAQSIEAAAIDREVEALHRYVEADRRALPYVGDHEHSTTACGRGERPGPDWPHW